MRGGRAPSGHDLKWTKQIYCHKASRCVNLRTFFFRLGVGLPLRACCGIDVRYPFFFLCEERKRTRMGAWAMPKSLRRERSR